MQIILKCAHPSGSAAFVAETIEGIPAPERRYEIVDHTVILDGYPDAVVHHDADVLLANPLYRMLTPQEQDDMTAAMQAASSVAETQQAASKAKKSEG